jgi:hypothetical protein
LPRPRGHGAKSAPLPNLLGDSSRSKSALAAANANEIDSVISQHALTASYS